MAEKAKEGLMRHDAIAFDTDGTVLDWHGSLVDELARVTRLQGIGFELHQFASDWRRARVASRRWTGPTLKFGHRRG
jgi:FMN phosphatase YigB (HAD superfamily)